MFINHKHKFIFIHIPKNAGTSIRNSFDIHGYDKRVVRRRYPHYICSEIKDYCGDDVWNEFYKFSVVRNPYERMVSYYHFHKSEQYKYPATAQKMGFGEWLERGLDNRLCITQTNYLNEDIDYIIRYENLQDDFNIVCDNINIERYVLPNYNTSQHDNYTQYYNSKEKEIVKDIFSEDFENFGYAI
tara:strand:+ start:83 stop:640 length:558 start_codon:yes stop_codon:yes gene_type:complete